jgi:ABC-type multidrug transport system permease subunit
MCEVCFPHFPCSSALIEIPYTFLCTAPAVTVFYFMAGYRADAEAYFQFMLSGVAGAYAMNSLGHWLAAALPNAETAMLVGGLVMTIANMFCGLFIVSAVCVEAWCVGSFVFTICLAVLCCLSRVCPSLLVGFGCTGSTPRLTWLPQPLFLNSTAQDLTAPRSQLYGVPC